MDRYKNQISLEAIGALGQQKLARSSVLVIGAGGLGCPALSHLAGAGIGNIGIVDGDIISLENLHRQLIYKEKEIGQFKVEVATKRLHELNGEIKITSYTVFLNKENAREIISEYDLIIDCTDQTSARYLINDVCNSLNKPWIFGALHQYEGQLAVFNYKNSGTYRCLFPETKEIYNSATCQQIGVLPTLPGIIGTMQANEALKIILEIPEIMSNKLLILDIRNWQIRKINFTKKSDPENFIDKYKDLEINYTELNNGHQLIDIRLFKEIEEFSAPHLPKIDPSTIKQYILEKKVNDTFVLVCHKGNRSRFLVQKLHAEGINNVKSLRRGITSIMEMKIET